VLAPALLKLGNRTCVNRECLALYGMLMSYGSRDIIYYLVARAARRRSSVVHRLDIGFSMMLSPMDSQSVRCGHWVAHRVR
jgi:hypothetical protein